MDVVKESMKAAGLSSSSKGSHKGRPRASPTSAEMALLRKRERDRLRSHKAKGTSQKKYSTPSSESSSRKAAPPPPPAAGPSALTQPPDSEMPPNSTWLEMSVNIYDRYLIPNLPPEPSEIAGIRLMFMRRCGPPSLAAALDSRFKSGPDATNPIEATQATLDVLRALGFIFSTDSTHPILPLAPTTTSQPSTSSDLDDLFSSVFPPTS